MKNLRKNYTLGEWIDLLISNLLGDVKVDEANKLHLIALLIPLVEKNYFLLHSSAIGKMLYGEATPLGAEISKPLSATKLVKLLRNQPDVISFNVLNENYTDCSNTHNMLKLYMTEGSVFSKKEEITSETSMVFWSEMGLQPKQNNKGTRRLAIDTAFLDRIYCYISDFEKKENAIKTPVHKSSLVNKLVSMVKVLREKDYTKVIDAYFIFEKKVTLRDQIAIRKTVSGLVKLLFPDEKYGKEDIRKCLEYAIGGRQLISDHLLYLLPDEFSANGRIEYSDLE